MSLEGNQDLPEFVFNKSAHLSPQVEKQATHFLKYVHIKLPEQESTMSLDRLGKIDDLVANQIEWIESFLHLSVNKRVPIINKIKFYTRDEFNKLAKRLGKPLGWMGGYSTIDGSIVLEELENENVLLQSTNHELVHALSRRTFRVSPNRNDSNVNLQSQLFGYENVKLRTFHYLTEIVTEMINIEQLDYMRNKGGPNYLDEIDSVYISGVILLDMLIEKVSANTGIDHETLRRRVYEGCFTGNLNMLKMFGRNELTLLAGLKDNFYADGVLATLAEFGLGLDSQKYKERVSQFREGGELVLSSGIKIRRNNKL